MMASYVVALRVDIMRLKCFSLTFLSEQQKSNIVNMSNTSLRELHICLTF